QLYVGMMPTYSPHVSEGKFCSPCHTLLSNTVDLSGVPTGGTFIEQATYHEWLNSAYPSQATVCQSCHMPQIEDAVILANGNVGLPGRTPFNLHQFAGANSFMVNLIKQNKTTLGVSAPDYNFDSTLAAITNMLTKQSLDVQASLVSITSDTAFIDVDLTNKAGHKFPSGYPSRRAVLQMIVTKANGDTLFASGLFDANYEMQNVATPFEQHHDIINTQTQNQIYEMVMGDVNGTVTTVLERAASHLKDNRIPPAGFSTLHYAYDTCKIVGSALTDVDFNKNGVTQGTGHDIVHYHIPLNNYSGTINVYTAVYYQTLPPAFLSDMSNYSSPEINSFLTMYANADKSPVKVDADTLLNISTGIKENTLTTINISPNPTRDGKVLLSGIGYNSFQLEVFDQNSKKINVILTRKSNSIELQLPTAKGLYFIRLNVNGQVKSYKILRI
ncbi:MAG: T9SS type A sorting domain-containing protein, partial [Bacteroidetes bacterium]|nr:T9SS type A sorting domain-containing protein [Bacteroidota bacterium]